MSSDRKWREHVIPHLEDGMCVCDCATCGADGYDCTCPDCDQAACGLHAEPQVLHPQMEAFAAHLTERGMTSCGPIVAVREWLTFTAERSSSPVGVTQ